MTRFPPIVNGTLTQVAAGGGAEDYTTDPTVGTAKWTGQTGVYVNDQDVSQDRGGATSILIERTVVVDDALAVDFERGDTITYSFHGSTETGTVRDVKTTTAPGLLGVVRLVLENA